MLKADEDLIGSNDISALTSSSLDDASDYKVAQQLGNDEAMKHMNGTAQRRVLQFLAARFHLLDLFVDEAEKFPTELGPDHRLLWVLVQAIPTQMLRDDPFLQIAKALQGVSIDDLRQQIQDVYSKLEHILSPKQPLFLFLDEIQRTTNDRMGEFRSDDGKRKRPLLRPIWLSLTGTLAQTQMQIILSGTGIDMPSLENVLASSVFKLEGYIQEKDVGAFDDPFSQKEYIERYIPSEQSPSWEAFLERAWGWCRGR